MQYRERFNPRTGAADESMIFAVRDDGSLASIPNDERNQDWQAFLKWKAEGNSPLPAEVPAIDPKEIQKKEAHASLKEMDLSKTKTTKELTELIALMRTALGLDG